MNSNKLIYLLNDQRFKNKDLNLSYRTINHYDSKGLLLSERSNDSSWRTYNAVEVIWLSLIIILREFGITIKNIQKLKHNIFIDGKYGNIDKAEFINQSFENEIADSILAKKELYILIFKDMTYTFHDDTSLKQWQNTIYKNNPHLNIPLSPIIQKIYKLLF